MKKFFVAVAVISVLFAASAFAGGSSYNKKSGLDLENKFYKMSGVIYKNADELGISQEQKEAVKQKKYELKKAMVRNKAEIDLVCLDMSQEAWKDKTDVNALNALVDKKYQLKAEKAKAAIKAYGDLNNSLSADQKKAVKELCEKDMKRYSKSCCSSCMQAACKKK